MFSKKIIFLLFTALFITNKSQAMWLTDSQRARLKIGFGNQQMTDEVLHIYLQNPTFQAPQLERNIFHAICNTANISSIGISEIISQCNQSQIQEALGKYDNDDKTPLRVAVAQGNSYLVALFLALGADATHPRILQHEPFRESILSLALTIPENLPLEKLRILSHLAFYLNKLGRLEEHLRSARYIANRANQSGTSLNHYYLNYTENFMNLNSAQNFWTMPSYKIPWIPPDRNPYFYCSLCFTIQTNTQATHQCGNCRCTFINHNDQFII